MLTEVCTKPSCVNLTNPHLMSKDRLGKLIELSREFGREDRGWAILGEGNTSAMGDSSYRWIISVDAASSLARPSWNNIGIN